MNLTRLFIAPTVIAIVIACSAFTGCGGSALPKPVNANGTVSPTVVLAEADVTYQNADAFVVTYIQVCHTSPTTPGCNDTLIANLKTASARALHALQSAHIAVNTLQPGSTGIDAALADLNAALQFLTGFTSQIPKPMVTGARS